MKKLLTMMDLSNTPEALKMLEARFEITYSPPSQEVLLETIGDFDCFLTPLGVRSDAEVISRAKRLKLIATPTTGTDHIDFPAAAAQGITVFSLREDRDLLNEITSTAEMAWALLLAVVRRLPWSFESVKSGNWESAPHRGHQLSGKTLGVLGYGRLGRFVEAYGRAFRMAVLICDNKPQPDLPPGVEQVEFEDLLRNSDVISIHIHLTEENKTLFDQRAFQMMKPGAVLINTSRGAVIDEGALLDALRNGPLAAAGVDVICGEDRPDIGNHPLVQYARSHSNLVISPHTGGVTFEPIALVGKRMAERIVAFMETFSDEGI
jgi:D-3-phosphoglycerate dehydrogenase